MKILQCHKALLKPNCIPASFRVQGYRVQRLGFGYLRLHAEGLESQQAGLRLGAWVVLRLKVPAWGLEAS